MPEKLYMRVNTAVRYGMVYLLSSRLPCYVVNEYPRSGGHWISLMLEQALEVPFVSNRIPLLRPSILHGHYLHPQRMKNVVAVWRDGRDVIVSLYYHCFFNSSNLFLVDVLRRDLPFTNYEDQHENLPAFIEYFFTKPRSPRFSWTDFVHRWHERPGVTHVRYEDLHRDTSGELQRVFLELVGKRLDPQRADSIAEQYSFNRLSGGRQSGQEDKQSFFRKGIVGDWRNAFSRKACEVFNHFAGSELILLGYERDRTWVHASERDNARASRVERI